MLLRFWLVKLTLSLMAPCMLGAFQLPSRAEIEQLEKDHQKALEHALTAKAVREFKEIVRSTKATLSGYHVPSAKQIVTVEASLYSRYTFRLDVELKFDKTWTKVVRFGKPAFQLHEVKKMERLEDGRFHVSYVADSQRRFGEREWKKLYQARGNFSVLGIQLIEDQPVVLFHEYWKTMR